MSIEKQEDSIDNQLEQLALGKQLSLQKKKSFIPQEHKNAIQ